MRLQIGAIAGLVMVVMAVMIAISYGTVALSTMDSGTNMTGSEYEEQYNTTVDGSQAAMGLLAIVPIIAGVLAVLLAVLMFKKML